MAGDINVAPADRDVYDPTLATAHPRQPPERDAVRRLLELGLIDLARDRHPDTRVHVVELSARSVRQGPRASHRPRPLLVGRRRQGHRCVGRPNGAPTSGPQTTHRLSSILSSEPKHTRATPSVAMTIGFDLLGRAS